MPLESATHISDLVTTNPDGSVDTKASLDDHIRMLKTVLKTDFPNITGPVTPTHTTLNKVGVTQAQSSNDTSPASTAYVRTAVAAASMSSTTPTVSGDAGKFWGTDGTTPAWTDLPVSTQAQMEAASSNAVLATPGTVNFHPGVAKAWIKCDPAGAIAASHNVTSITDNGTGDVTVTIATDFSSANYSVTCSVLGSSYMVGLTAQAAGSFQMNCVSLATANPIDPAAYFAACFGDQA